MSGNSEKIFIQCTHCGYIYEANVEICDDDLYVDCKCARCDNERGLYIGDNLLEDKYLFYDPVLDERYY